jgi:trigger factor
MTTDTAQSPFTLSVQAPETWKRVIGVSIDRAWFDGEYARNLGAARRGHARPGFRKGKVPLAMVEKDLGGEVRMETVEQVLPRAYRAAVLEHKLVPVADPELTDLKLEEQGPVLMELSVEVRPDVVARDYLDLPLVRSEVKLADGAVDEALEALREGRAVWEHVDRTAAPGDRLKTDIVPETTDGEPEPAGPVRDYVFELGAEGNFAEFDAELTGAAAGDERRVTVTYPGDYGNERVRGRTVSYLVTVQDVQARRLPELDDAFAAAVKEGQTLLELRLALRDELLAGETRRAEQLERERIVDLLIERNPVEPPPSLVEEYLTAGVNEMKQRSAYLGRPVDEQDEQRYRESGRAWAARSLKAMLILEAIRRQEEIAVTPPEVEARIAAIAAENGFPADDYLAYVRQHHEDERIAQDLAEQKAFDFLRARAAYRQD